MSNNSETVPEKIKRLEQEVHQQRQRISNLEYERRLLLQERKEKDAQIEKLNNQVQNLKEGEGTVPGGLNTV